MLFFLNDFLFKKIFHHVNFRRSEKLNEVKQSESPLTDRELNALRTNVILANNRLAKKIEVYAKNEGHPWLTEKNDWVLTYLYDHFKNEVMTVEKLKLGPTLPPSSHSAPQSYIPGPYSQDIAKAFETPVDISQKVLKFNGVEYQILSGKTTDFSKATCFFGIFDDPDEKISFLLCDPAKSPKIDENYNQIIKRCKVVLEEKKAAARKISPNDPKINEMVLSVDEFTTIFREHFANHVFKGELDAHKAVEEEIIKGNAKLSRSMAFNLMDKDNFGIPTTDRKGNVIPVEVSTLDQFIEKSSGVCRHWAFATAIIAQRALKEYGRDNKLGNKPLFPIGDVTYISDLIGDEDDSGHSWLGLFYENHEVIYDYHWDSYWNRVNDMDTYIETPTDQTSIRKAVMEREQVAANNHRRRVAKRVDATYR